MNTQIIASFIQKGRNGFVRNCPKIFAGIAVAGTITTAVLAVRETPKAIQLLDEKKGEMNRPVLTKKETIQTAWKCYIPAAVSGILTIAAIIAGHSIQLQRNAELAVAYGLSQTAMRLYSEHVAKEIGNEKEAEIRQQTGLEMVRQLEIPQGKMIALDTTSPQDPESKLETWFDYYSGRYFHDTKNHVITAINLFNESFLKTEGRGCLNDLYSCFNNPDELPTDSASGNLLGWKFKENEAEGVRPMVSYGPDKNGSPCYILDFYNPPQYEF